MRSPKAAPVRAALALSCFVAYSLVNQPALAHVALDSPNGGETLVGGSTTTIEWHPLNAHDTIGWSLWYSGESASGPWTSIALDLEPGNTAVNSVHTYEWVVPEVNLPSAWVRVVQENDLDPDYSDVSDTGFAIIAGLMPGDFNADGVVDLGDFTVWRDGLGDRYTVDDYYLWRAAFGDAAGATRQPLPTPSGAALAAIGLLAAGRRRSR